MGKYAYMKKLILASASPRRKQILTDAGFEFDILTSDKEGEIDKITPPDKFAVRCAINTLKSLVPCLPYGPWSSRERVPSRESTLPR